MANKSVFASVRGKLLPKADVKNRAGGKAYDLGPRHKLAQLAITGCLNGTFYTSAEEQLSDVLDLAQIVDPEFVAKTAIYAREKGLMKDMPALLLATLTVPNAKGEYRPELVAPVFNRVITNGKMLRNFVQIMRSGVVGRKSLGTAPKRLIQNWLVNASDTALIRSMVGQAPSLADVIKMVHPKPVDPSREALFGYVVGRKHDFSKLPQAIKDFELYKTRKRKGRKVPTVPFQMLTSLDLGREEWTEIAENAGWQMLRMNLNTFYRHGVFKRKTAVNKVANRLANAEDIRRANVFPYQIMAAYMATRNSQMPGKIRDALHDALEIATENVPRFAGRVAICPDVSGSMSWAVTGWRRGSTSAVRCIDVAGLMTSVILRNSEDAIVLPFEVCVADVDLSARDTVLTNAEKLSAIGGGGTNCSAPLAHLNHRKAEVDLVIIVSDNESWADRYRGRETGLMREWARLKARNPHAKLVCLDIVPNTTAQAVNREDILNIGGFSDQVFNVIGEFAKGKFTSDHFVKAIEDTDIRSKT